MEASDAAEQVAEVRAAAEHEGRFRPRVAPRLPF